MVEEYINGISVADVLSEGAYSESAAANIMNQLFEVLAVLHSENIVHRDIKPENIMISSDGVVKLIDFRRQEYSADINLTTQRRLAS